MISFLVVGSGYRSEYFGRVAGTYPDLFRALFLCRSEEKARRITARTGIRAVTDEDAAAAFRPDFVVVAVDRGHMAEVIVRWAEKGFPVLAETPVGETEEQLDAVWKLGQSGARIVSCEQYFRQPVLAGGLKAVADGLIGAPSSVYISLLHDYHAAGLVRKALGIPAGEGYSVWCLDRSEPVAETDSRAAAVYDGRPADACRRTALVLFDSGKQALYDFCPVQYRSYIRSRHLVVRGSRGEWSDTVVSYLDGAGRPRKLFLLADIPEKYRCLDTQALRDRRRNWQDSLAPDTVQDEYAIATFLLDMAEYLRGGNPPYTLEEAVADAVFGRMLRQAAADPMKQAVCPGIR